MENWRIYLLIAVAVALAVLSILTWGSLGSAVCLYCLITMAAGLLFKKFLVERDPNKFDLE